MIIILCGTRIKSFHLVTLPAFLSAAFTLLASLVLFCDMYSLGFLETNVSLLSICVNEQNHSKVSCLDSLKPMLEWILMRFVMIIRFNLAHQRRFTKMERKLLNVTHQEPFQCCHLPRSWSPLLLSLWKLSLQWQHLSSQAVMRPSWTYHLVPYPCTKWPRISVVFWM